MNSNEGFLKGYCKIINIYIRLVIFILLVLFVVSCNNLYTASNIYGNWKGSYFGHELSFVFKRDSTCVITYFEKRSNKFKTINGNYELDFLKTPIPLSIRNIPQLNHPLHTIIEFICDDTIRIADFSPKWRLRPISFVPGKVINLKRITKKGKNNESNTQ